MNKKHKSKILKELVKNTSKHVTDKSTPEIQNYYKLRG